MTLTLQDKSIIGRFGFSTFHDYKWMSLYAGEPFLENGVISYYDGRLVRIYGFPLNKKLGIGNDFLFDLVKYWATEEKAEAILFMGSNPLNFNYLFDIGFWRTALKPRRAISSELSINCSCDCNTFLNNRFNKRIRSMALESNVTTGGLASAEYLKLIEEFYQLRDLTIYLADIAFAIPAILQFKEVRIIEARKEGGICGLLALHKPFKDIAVALFLVHDNRTKGVSDFLMGKMIEVARSLGARKINVGSSKSIGQYNFKRKWGGKVLVPPYYMVMWARGVLADSFYPTWGPRLLEL